MSVIQKSKREKSLWQHVIDDGKWYALIALVAANGFIWYAIFAESRGNVLTVAFLDVGQGDAVYIEAPNGNQLLIDGGPNRRVLRALSGVMPFYDRSVDVVLATHPDKDHIGGLIDVLSRYDVETFMDPGVQADTGTYRTLLRLIEVGNNGRTMERVVARRGQKIALDDGVALTILFPDRNVENADTNSASVVARLVYGDAEFLFTGDAPKAIERYLVALDGTRLASDVLKVGHHGSKTSTSEVFLGFVAPSYAVISSGADNRYGHPHAAVMKSLEHFGVESFTTARDGTVVFATDGKRVWRK